MVTKPTSCKECPLYKKGTGFVLPDTPDWSQIDMIVVGEAPGSDEVDDAKPFVGKAGKQLKMILRHVSIDPKRVYCDNTLRCLPPLNKSGEYYPIGKERQEAEKCCSQYDKVDSAPKYIPMLLVGGKALKKYMGYENISDWHGNIELLNGRVVGCTFHPSAVMRNMNLLPTAIAETQHVIDAGKNPAMLLVGPKVIKCQ